MREKSTRTLPSSSSSARSSAWAKNCALSPSLMTPSTFSSVESSIRRFSTIMARQRLAEGGGSRKNPLPGRDWVQFAPPHSPAPLSPRVGRRRPRGDPDPNARVGGSNDRTRAERSSDNRRVRVGILADTHGLLRPRVLELLAGCDRLLHAG